MSIFKGLKFWRTSVFKTLGVTTAVVLTASLVAAPAQAVEPAGDQIRVYGTSTDIGEGRVCVVFEEGHEIPSYATPEFHTLNNLPYGLSIDLAASDEGAVAVIEEVEEAAEGCDIEYQVSGILTGVNTQFRFDAWIIDASIGFGGPEDGQGSGSTANEIGEFAEFGEWIDDLRTDVGLAYQNDQVQDERHTAFLCVAAAEDTDTAEYALADEPVVTAYDESAAGWATDDLDIEVELRADLLDPSCGPEFAYEVYVGDLSLGHTYTFYAQAVTDHTVLDEEGNELYTDQHWSYSAAVQFTPLDIRQNQVGVFPSNNGGNNGSNNFYTFDYTLNNGVDYVNEVVRGDALSYNEPICVDVDINDECIWEYPNPLTTDGLHDINYSNVDVITPVSYRGEVLETDADRMSFVSTLSVWDRDGLVDTVTASLFDANGGLDADADFSGRWGNLLNFNGQAYVESEVAESTGVFQGLAGTYSENREVELFTPDSIRATSDSSLELTLDTMRLQGEDPTRVVDASEGTYRIRLLPNYGDGTPNFWTMFFPGMSEYTGNKDLQRPVRYEAIDFTFEPGDYTVIECFEEGVDLCANSGLVKFDLNGLDAGTAYSVEFVASFPVDDDALDGDVAPVAQATALDEDADLSSVDPLLGDGGYDTVEVRDSAYWYGTTYMSSQVINVNRTSAEFAINITDSHYADKANILDAGYLGINECSWNPEAGSTSSGNADDPNWDCSAWNADLELSDRFSTRQVSRMNVTTRFIGGQLYAVVSLTGLNPDKKYEVVWGADYYHTGDTGEDLIAPFEMSNRGEMVDTLDGDRCNLAAFGYDYSAMMVATDGGTDCYNSVGANRIYRTDVASFVTVEDMDPYLVDGVIYGIDENMEIYGVWYPGDTGVTVDRPVLHFTWSEKVRVNGVGKTVVLRNTDNGDLITIPLSSRDVKLYDAVDGDYSILDIKLPELEYATWYEFEIPAGAFVDLAGNEFQGLAGRDFDFETEYTDVTGPDLIDVFPANGDLDVSVDTDLIYTFDENVYKGDSDKWIQVRFEDSETEAFRVNVTSNRVEIDGNMVYVDIPQLKYGTNYCVTFEEGSFEDFNGNEAEALTADGQCFETEFDMEPVLVETTPADLETDVSVNTNLEFVFSEDVWKGVVGKKIKVWNVDSGKVIAVDVTSAKVSGAGDTWTVDIPTLEYSTNYEVTIDGAAFYDSVGNPFAGLNGSDMRFRTEPTDVTAPLIVETDPADGDTDVDVNTDLTAYFSEPVRKGDVGKTIKIWKTATAQVVATVDVSSALVTIDDDVVTVVWPTLEFATDYYVTIDRGAFYDLAGNEFMGLAGSDLEFQTEPTDNIPPTLVSIETTDVDNNGVDTDTSLILTFSENVMAGNAPVLLMRKDNSSVVQSFIPSASKRLTIEDNVVTIKRDFWLRYATEYYVYVPAGSFIDDAGNAYLGNDNDTTEFLTEKKPAYLGKVTVSGSYNDGWRDFTVKMGAKFANSGYKLIRVERATGKLYVIRSGFLNEDGYAAIKADVNHLHRLDDVYVRIGRHYLAYHRVKTN